jgi:L-glutamine:2-deoxy-scyllo-inosose/3-amino-2,3-dideoxy-scyllo-inosose aminotransferase
MIIVHLYGSMTDVAKAKQLCKKRGIYLIEDCAHQHGSFWKGKGVGAHGDVGCFSFQESKCLPSGEGGFNMCQNKALFERLYSLRNCGRGYLDDMTHAIQSGNYRLSEWQAGILMGGLRRLDKQVKTKDANGQYLNGLLAQVPGILPMRRRKQVTQQGMYNYTFRLDWEKLGVRGITNAEFSTALSAELGMHFEPPYDPLNDCALYKPHTKRRHKLNAEYWKAINPKRFKLPVATDAHKKSGVAVMHNALLGTKRDMDDIAEAVAKVVQNLDQLKNVPKAVRKRWRALAEE